MGRGTRECATGNKRDQGAARKQSTEEKKPSTVTLGGRTEKNAMINAKITKARDKREDEERENNQDEYRGFCTDNLDPVLKTNTVGPQSFAVAANLVYGPYAYREDSPEMNQEASGARLA